MSGKGASQDETDERYIAAAVLPGMTERTPTVADSTWMARALQLARRGMYTAAPNPCVGCVVVNGGRIVGEGWHRKTGSPHAEAMALAQAGKDAQGSDVYLTLEPCTHHGRTPPCSDALIAAGIARAIIAARDPNPRVSGVDALAAAGIETRVGVCEKQAYELNRGFFTRMQRQRPWIRVKFGMSVDGRIAPESGKSRWITGVPARRDVQLQRARCDALLTGAGTVLEDDPRLTLRPDGGQPAIDEAIRQPLRVVVDGGLRTGPDARVYRLPGKSILATCCEDTGKFSDSGVEIWHFRSREGHVPLAELFTRLAELEINEVQVESGSGLSGALIAQGLYDEILLYVAPFLLGGKGVPIAGLEHITSLEQREKLEYCDIRKIGDDIRIRMRRVEL